METPVVIYNHEKMAEKSKVCNQPHLLQERWVFPEYICHFRFGKCNSVMNIKKLHTKSEVHSSSLLLFRKPEFFHRFSVIQQHKNYTYCIAEVKFSKKATKDCCALHI